MSHSASAPPRPVTPPGSMPAGSMPAGSMPAGDRAPRQGGAYDYDVERVDPRAPGRLHAPSGPGVRKRRAWVQWLVWGSSILGLLLVSVVVYIYAIRPLGVGTSLVAFTLLYGVLAVVWFYLMRKAALKGIPIPQRDQKTDELDTPAISFGY